jgi:hypothetical protein
MNYSPSYEYGIRSIHLSVLWNWFDICKCCGGRNDEIEFQEFHIIWLNAVNSAITWWVRLHGDGY